MKDPRRTKEFDFHDVSVLRWLLAVLGVVLIAGGTLRLHAFATACQEDDLWPLMDALLSEAEIFFGLWLAVGRDPVRTRPWAVAILAGLWASSLYRGFVGNCSCGRFGTISVNPWVVTIFDLIAITCLLRWGRSRGDRADEPPSSYGVAAMIFVAMLVAATGIGRPLLVSTSGTAVRRGSPLADVPLTFRGRSVRLEVRTDGQGGFLLPPVRPGRYAVSVAAVVADPDRESKAPGRGSGNASRRPAQKAKSKATRTPEVFGRHNDIESLALEIAECGDRLKIDFQ